MAVRVTRAGVGLTIGIIVLAGLVLGGLFLVRQRGETARNDATMKIAEQKLKDESNQGVALNQGGSNQSGNQGSNNSGASGNTNSGSNSSNSSASTNNSTATTNSGSNSSSATELPQTGPAEDFYSFIVLAALVFSGVSYWRSRRRLFQA